MKKLLVTFFLLAFSKFIYAQSLQSCVRLFEANKMAEAKTSFNSYLKKHPKDIYALEYLGDIAFKEKKWNKAVEYFKSLVNIQPQNALYHYKFGGAIGMKAKHNKLRALFLIDDIKFHFKKAAVLDPKFVDVRLALVQLYLELPLVLGGGTSKATFYANELALIDDKWGKHAQQLINDRK